MPLPSRGQGLRPPDAGPCSRVRTLSPGEVSGEVYTVSPHEFAFRPSPISKTATLPAGEPARNANAVADTNAASKPHVHSGIPGGWAMPSGLSPPYPLSPYYVCGAPSTSNAGPIPVSEGRPSAGRGWEALTHTQRRHWITTLAAFAAVLTMGMLVAAMPTHTSTVADYVSYVDPDQVFTTDAPAGWDQNAVVGDTDPGLDPTASDMRGVRLSDSNASITITTDRLAALSGPRIGSALSLATSASTPSGDPVKTWDGVEGATLVEFARGEMRDEVDGYREAESPILMKTGWGKAWCTEWTARAPHGAVLPQPMHGFLVCMVGEERTAVVTCQCLSGDWTKLMPGFYHVIDSITETGAVGNSSPSTAPATLYIPAPSAAGTAPTPDANPQIDSAAPANGGLQQAPTPSS
ncbi:MAG: hypothetical protein ACLQVD_09785 [Capsulimonadaceae bacterium]